MARLGGWAWGLGRWLQGDHPPSTVVRWVQSWSRRILGVGVVWDCGGTSAGVGPLLGGKQGFYGVRGLVMQRELCRSSSAALQNPRRNKERNVSKTFTQQKMLRGGPRYRSRRAGGAKRHPTSSARWPTPEPDPALHSTQFDRLWG